MLPKIKFVVVFHFEIEIENSKTSSGPAHLARPATSTSSHYNAEKFKIKAKLSPAEARTELGNTQAYCIVRMIGFSKESVIVQPTNFLVLIHYELSIQSTASIQIVYSVLVMTACPKSP